MAFSMSYDSKPPAPPAKKAAAPAAEPAKPARTGRAARANSPQARAEALFQKPSTGTDGDSSGGG